MLSAVVVVVCRERFRERCDLRFVALDEESDELQSSLSRSIGRKRVDKVMSLTVFVLLSMCFFSDSIDPLPSPFVDLLRTPLPICILMDPVCCVRVVCGVPVVVVVVVVVALCCSHALSDVLCGSYVLLCVLLCTCCVVLLMYLLVCGGGSLPVI